MASRNFWIFAFAAFVACEHFCSAMPNSYGGYIKCSDGSSPQKDANGQTIACTPGVSYGACTQSYQCATPLPGRPGVCCLPKTYVAGTQGPPTYGPTAVTYPPPATDNPATMPPVNTEQPPPPPVGTSGPDNGAGGNGANMTPPPPTDGPVVTDAPTAATEPTIDGGAQTPPAPGPDTTMNVGGGSATDTTLSPGDGSVTDSGNGGVDVVTDSNGSVHVSPDVMTDNNHQTPPFEVAGPQQQNDRRSHRRRLTTTRRPTNSTTTPVPKKQGRPLSGSKSSTH